MKTQRAPPLARSRQRLSGAPTGIAAVATTLQRDPRAPLVPLRSGRRPSGTDPPARTRVSRSSYDPPHGSDPDRPLSPRPGHRHPHTTARQCVDSRGRVIEAGATICGQHKRCGKQRKGVSGQLPARTSPLRPPLRSPEPLHLLPVLSSSGTEATKIRSMSSVSWTTPTAMASSAQKSLKLSGNW